MVVRHAFTVGEWHCLGGADVFGEDSRLEVLNEDGLRLGPKD